MDAAVGELVAAEVLPGRGLGLRGAKIVERLGSMADPRSVSLVAIHTNDIPYVFPPTPSPRPRPPWPRRSIGAPTCASCRW